MNTDFPKSRLDNKTQPVFAFVGTLAAAYFFKDLAAKGATHYISLDGAGDIDSVKKELLQALQS